MQTNMSIRGALHDGEDDVGDDVHEDYSVNLIMMMMMIAEGDDNVNYKDDHADQLWWGIAL